MTTHARQQIREAVATRLTGLAATGSRVFQSRMRAQKTLPCLLIACGDERIEQGIQTAQDRSLEIIVTGLAKATANVDDALDAIALQVETAIASAPFTTPNCLLSLAGIETGFDESLEAPVGEIRLTFKALYFTSAANPGAAL